jgi:tetratricopeptide (TPR) repeat protein
MPLEEKDKELKYFYDAVDKHPMDAENWYALGVMLINSERDRARDALLKAITLNADQAKYHAMLGYTLYWDESTIKEAMAAFGKAHQLDPKNALYETFWITLLSIVAPEDEAFMWIETAAKRQGIDLDIVRQALQNVGFPMTPSNVVRNAFCHAFNFFQSYHLDEVERLLTISNPKRARKQKNAEEREYRKAQIELKKQVFRSNVPKELRKLVPFAQQLGLGDDVYRGQAITQVSSEQKEQIIEGVDSLASVIHHWLDSFGKTTMPPEAAAFLYLMTAVEEMRL